MAANVTSNATACVWANDQCVGCGLFLPLVDETIWSLGFRAVLYFIGLIWSFTAVALIADIFMCAIEVITSQTTTVKVAKQDAEGGFIEVEVRVWNDTVANLTLMALGSSMPEIMLSIIEVFSNNFEAGELGPGTIVGSAAFNLLVIIAVCVMSIPEGETRKVDRMKVFIILASFSVFAYLWLVIILMASSPNEVSLWEAIVTFMLLPVLIVLAFMTDKGYCGERKSDGRMEIEMGEVEENATLVRNEKSDEERTKEMVVSLLGSLDHPERINAEDAANITVKKLQDTQTHSRAWYRVKASRELFAGQRIDPALTANMQKLSDSTTPGKMNKKMVLAVNGFLGHKKPHTEIEFDTVSNNFMENCGQAPIVIVRSGDLSADAKVRVQTIDGTATAGEDYEAIDQVVTFKAGETRTSVLVTIVDDNVWEPDETFFLRLSVLDPSESDEDEYVRLGKKIINQITIINDDEPGTVDFTKPSYLIKESVGTALLPLQRTNGADGQVVVNWKTTWAGKEGAIYQNKEGTVTFEHGECEKNIEIAIINDHATEKDENFQITLSGISEGAKLGSTTKTVVTVVGDDEFDSMVRRVIAQTHLKMASLKLGSSSWAEQLKNAMNVNGGDVESATWGDYFMHFITFGFKVIFSVVPPPQIWGGWACFCVALIFITLLTVIIKDLASTFGCLIDLKPSVNAILLVALGTSLPDLFASKTAAMCEKYADNSIGNVTGSNSVNVFFGLGVPWLICAIYHYVKTGTNFQVPAAGLGFSVTLYSICAILCIITLVIRRYSSFFGNAMLGGPNVPKYMTSAFFILLWVIYVTVSSLNSYGIIQGF